MAEAQVNGEPVAYDLTGPEQAPVLVLLASLGTDRRVWDAQVPAFKSWFRVLRIDHPGHYGGSAPTGPYWLRAWANASSVCSTSSRSRVPISPVSRLEG